jgi:PAS domain S-box-containing protein
LSCKDVSASAKPEVESVDDEGGLSKECHFLFENMLNGFAYCRLLFDAQGNAVNFVYLRVNDAFAELVHAKKESVIGKRGTEVIPGIEKTNPELLEIYSRVACEGKGEKFEVFVEPLNIWVLCSVYCPKKNHFIAIFENVTTRKAHDKLLRSHADSMERFMLLTDALPLIVFETDLEGKLTYVNQKGFELTGYTKEDFDKGLSCFSFFGHKNFERVKRDFLKSIATSASSGIEYSFIRKDSSEFPALIRGSPIMYGDRTVGLRGIV